MNGTVQKILDQIVDLQTRLQDELHERSNQLYVNVANGRIEFERRLREHNRELKVGVARYIRRARLRVILTAPVIYFLIVPFALLDIFVSLYQLICFTAYGIPRVNRSKYFDFDRMKLDYLNFIEKLNCGYCSYCNGVIAYSREVAARTEQRWCPIKHARRRLDMHSRYPLFTEYGDGEEYRSKVDKIKTSID